jgi:hypothetical protein
LKKFIPLILATISLLVSLSTAGVAQVKNSSSYLNGISVTQQYEGPAMVFRTVLSTDTTTVGDQLKDLQKNHPEKILKHALQILVRPGETEKDRDIELAVSELTGKKLGVVKVSKNDPLRRQVKSQRHKGVDYYAYQTIPLYIEIPKGENVGGIVIKDTGTGESIEIKQVYLDGMNIIP